MDRLTAALVAAASIFIAAIAAITYYFGLLFLVRLIFGIGYALLSVVFAVLLGVLVYARSRYAALAVIGLASSTYAAYSCYTGDLLSVAYITIAYIAAIAFGIWYISEPDLSIVERLRSAEGLERSGNHRAAARKYEKSGNYLKAAECYEKAGMLESAAWCYERAEMFERAAELYERLASEKGDTYYWREASEFYKKAGKLLKAAECLEKYAEDEPWFWEDVAKLYEEAGSDKSVEAWRKALEYYTREAEEEGVFWEDVAKIYERLGESERAREAWKKYAEYCEREAEKDSSWWRHAAEAYEKLGMKEKAEEARMKAQKV